METISRLPAPKLRLERSISMDKRLDFLPFHERATDCHSKILCVDAEGRTVLYDTDTGVLHSVPDLHGPKWANPISFSVVDRDPRDPARADASTSCAGTPGAPTTSTSRPSCTPTPPTPASAGAGSASVVRCHALIRDDDPGRRDPVLMVSSTESSRVGTYCFNTYINKWFKAGGWTLPFVGRAERVPELENLWFGVANDRPYALCAMDLCSFDSVQAPSLVYSWEHLDLPDDWVTTGCKFCLARILEFWNDNDHRTGMGAVLSGLEVVRHGEPSSKLLTMVKHKSKFYKFIRDEIQCILSSTRAWSTVADNF